MGISVVGLHGGSYFGPGAAKAISDADVLVGAPRHLESVSSDARLIEWASPIEVTLDEIEALSSGLNICVLASGDPGFFGIVRLLADRFTSLEVHPAPSSVSLAFGKLGVAWDDAVVVSAHGRSPHEAVAAIRRAAKSAVLTSPASPPEQIGRLLIESGTKGLDVAVVSRLGEDESVTITDLDGLAEGTFDPMSVVIFTAPHHRSRQTLAWGLPEDEFLHRNAMITKAEVRAVALGKLAIPQSGVLWDVGAGSGSVGIECASLAPALDVWCIESDPESVERINQNAEAHGVVVTSVLGTAPDALGSLPDPDRIFVGGGGIDVIKAALTRLRPGGQIVANYAILDRAVEAWHLLGNMVEISVSRGLPTGTAGVRLNAENPVFICWGQPSATPGR